MLSLVLLAQKAVFAWGNEGKKDVFELAQSINDLFPSGTIHCSAKLSSLYLGKDWIQWTGCSSDWLGLPLK